MKTRKFIIGRRAALAVPLTIALLAGAASSMSSTAPTKPAAPSARAIEVADSLSEAFRGAAAAITPSVVNIATVATPIAPSEGSQQLPPQIPEEFRRFFRFGPGENPFGQPGVMPERRGEGSGVIIWEDSYILTNNQVVDGATEITVRLHDEREFNATVVGIDPESDLAVIHIEASGLTPARLGDSDTLQPGDWIVAVGSPFGLDHTVTAGVVSATGRAGMGLNTYEDFIQTDAAINPGNSGGPMVNLHGEVIGINSAIRSAAGGNNGVGFAIPVNLAMHVADSLIADGTVERGWLGVSVQPLTPDLATSLGIEGEHGALVADVVAGTPAASAGIESGDVITAVDRKPVDAPRTLMNTIAQHEPGDRVTLAVDRGGSSRTFDVTLGQRPGAATLAATPGTARPEATLGLSVQPLTPALAAQLGLQSDSGLVITEVLPGSPADKAGLQAEDVILEAARQPVRSIADLTSAVTQSPKQGLLLKISRAGHPLFMVLKPAS